MHAMDSGLLADRLVDLRADYGAALPGKLERLHARSRHLMPEADNAAALETIRAELHALAGSAGTFGFADIGEEARALERFIAPLARSRQDLSQAEARMLQLGLEDMVMRARTPQQPLTDRIAVLSSNPQDALMRRLTSLGFNPIAIDSLDAAIELPAGTAWRGILIDADCPSEAIAPGLERLRRVTGAAVPCIGFACSDDFTARYAAAKMGTVGFLANPARLGGLQAALQDMLNAQAEAPYRILYLGPSAPALESGAFLIQAEADPATLLERIAAFRPELLLLRMEPSEYDAVALARMVWQDAAGREIGIFFLANDDRVARAFTAQGITDAYVIPGSDPDLIRQRIVRYLHARRTGLRAPNYIDFGPALLRWRQAEPETDRHQAARRVATDTRAAPANVPARPRSKILIVDDDRYLVAMLAHALSLRGAEVLRAYGGEQGYGMAWQEMPTAIITDIEMPEGNGERMILQLRTNPRTRHIPVIVMTNRRWEDGRDYALEREMRGRLGVAAYLQKPVEMDTLVQELTRL